MTIGIEELMDVLVRLNRKLEMPVDEDVLKQIIALVLKNPLDEDRAQCQEQIALIVSQHVGDGTHED